MATIRTIAPNRYEAEFNQRHLSINTVSDYRYAVDADSGEVITGAELKGIKRLVEWHIWSERTINELPVLWTVRKANRK